MEIRGKLIGGLEAVRVRDAFIAFLEIETVKFVNGEVRYERKTITDDFLAQQLNLDREQGAGLLAVLIADGYVDQAKRTPTPQGMALAHAQDRERLALGDARKILGNFLEAVRKVNARPELRMTIDRVHVFGSYLAGAETVGDIDLILDVPSPESEEDFEQLDAVIAEVHISEYLSFHEELDTTAADAEKEVIYQREVPALLRSPEMKRLTHTSARERS
jgi:predicted nucleotidyltransferase